jgi:hypothetical protein
MMKFTANLLLLSMIVNLWRFSSHRFIRSSMAAFVEFEFASVVVARYHGLVGAGSLFSEHAAALSKHIFHNPRNQSASLGNSAN